MPLLMLLIAAQAAQPGGVATRSVSPPPVVTYTPPPPVMVTNTAEPAVVMEVRSPGPRIYAIPEANEAPPDMIELRVRSGSELLWEGRLRVAKPGASLIQHINETEPSGCPPSAYAQSVHSSLTASVQRNKLSITPEGAFNYHVRVAWERPSSARGCGNEGARRVEVTQGVDLRPGQSTTLKGDVGLVVEVRRR